MKWPESRSVNGGEQKLFSFENGYGASLVRHFFSYGGEEGLWELMVLHNDFPCYTSPITDDVIGYLNDAEADAFLEEIARLPKKFPDREIY
jgi:hypothetical protein